MRFEEEGRSEEVTANGIKAKYVSLIDSNKSQKRFNESVENQKVNG